MDCMKAWYRVYEGGEKAVWASMYVKRSLMSTARKVDEMCASRMSDGNEAKRFHKEVRPACRPTWCSLLQASTDLHRKPFTIVPGLGRSVGMCFLAQVFLVTQLAQLQLFPLTNGYSPHKNTPDHHTKHQNRTATPSIQDY